MLIPQYCYRRWESASVIHGVDLIGYDVGGQMTTSYNTTISVDVQSSDLDEDIVELRYSWSVDGYPMWKCKSLCGGLWTNAK